MDVSILSLGGVLGTSELLVFRQAFLSGVRYWDTADSYRWGNNEKAIGKYFERFPEDRKQVFLVTKSGSSDPKGLGADLAASLARMKTDYVDMYFLHGVSDAKNDLTPAVKAWAEQAKREGKIRLFGFSAHKNMEEGMFTAARLGWIDGLMVSYNYRLMTQDRMKRAVDACTKAGIGLTAMKTQAAFSANFYASVGSETDDGLKMTQRLMEKGYTAEQAKLKVVWENPSIASICSAMSNMTILQANVAAAVSKTPLSSSDRRRLLRYAQRTAPGYCAGCAEICETAEESRLPISDIMRHAMYRHSYGERDRAARYFRSLPVEVKGRLRSADFSNAEKACPQRIPIARVVAEIREELG
ncbi:MAG: aldo/keto reductase [Desulfobacterales bacterium]